MLIKCPECGEQISDQAGACPHCGAPIQRGSPGVDGRATYGQSRRARDILLFFSLVAVLLDAVLYVLGRLVLISRLRDSFNDFMSDYAAAKYGKFIDSAYLERDLVVYAGGLLFVVIGVLLSWVAWRALRLGRSRRSTRWILGCSVSLGIVATLTAGWAFWASSYLPLPSSFFPEFSRTWSGWRILKYRIPSYLPQQWSLVPVLSSIFLVCSLIAVAVRAAYTRVFERQ